MLHGHSPLTPEHLHALAVAAPLHKKIRNMTTIAMTDATLTAIFTGLTLLGSLVFFSWSGLLIGLGMAGITAASVHGAWLAKAIDPRAPKILAGNQLVLCALLIAYSLWSIYAAATGPSPLAAAMPELANDPTMTSINHLTWVITLAVYLSLIAGTLIAQGLTASYYFSRRKHINAYLTQTPQWIIILHRSGQA